MTPSQLAALIHEKTGNKPVEIGLIMGSGLSGLVDKVDDPCAISYADLPGFPAVGVSGHNPKLVIGQMEGVNVALFGGRAHYYEHGEADVMRVPLETLRALGADKVFISNSAGSLRPAIAPGDLMLIIDHINLSGANPLIGESSEKRFIDMVGAYDAELADMARAAAVETSIQLHEGVYAWFSGPNFETPAEIRMAGIMGVDAVGMSTVPEVILARFLGLRAIGVSNITNMGAGLDDKSLSHEHTKKMAGQAAQRFEMLLRAFLCQLKGGSAKP